MIKVVKQWHTQSVKHKLAAVLIMDGISFYFNPKDGIVFSAPEIYVKRLIERLMTCYGVSLKPIITELE